jgi:hypothetical protein
MANSLSAYNPEFWAKTAQVLHKPKAIYRQLANFRGEAMLKSGDVFHRVLPTTTRIQDYTRYSDITAQDAIGTDESLTVDQEKAFRIEIDDLDEVQANLSLASLYAGNAIRDLTNTLDSDFLFESTNADKTIDAADIGGTSGDAIALTGSNVFDVFSKVHEKLGENNVSNENLYGVVSPAVAQVIEAQVGSRETDWGDDVTRKGFSGRMMRYNGMDLFVTNNITHEASLEMATNPTNTDDLTITLDGEAVTVTFVSSIGSTAGNVLIAGTVDGTRANLEGLINAPTTTSSTQVAYTGNDLYVMQRCSAVNDDTANTMAFFSKGLSLTVAETFTDATDTWNSTIRDHIAFGKRGSVDFVTQITPKMEMRKETRRFGTNLLGLSLYGVQTFTDGSEQMVDAEIAQ